MKIDRSLSIIAGASYFLPARSVLPFSIIFVTMKLIFPEGFAFGTSTSAYQIETAVDLDWTGARSRDGHVFSRTTDHEMRIAQDVEIIASLAPHYRMSLMWSKLQVAPLAPLEPAACRHYHRLLEALQAKDVKIMMVLHHFANAAWFTKKGGWEKKENIELWLDFARKLVLEFGQYVDSWNTFNEPNLYTSMAWAVGEFPPYKKNVLLMRQALKNIGVAHEAMYAFIKEHFPKTPVGISHNCTLFEAENILGIVPAKFLDYTYMEAPPKHFKSLDFFGMSYYARIGHDPLPVTYLTTPEKLAASGKPHDDMWEYYPAGLGICMRRYWKQYQKPIIITENGICTQDDRKRVQALRDYLTVVHDCLNEGIDVRGYYHWSTWDNFEWSLGPTYHFGLYSVDSDTKDRHAKPSARVYSEIAHSNVFETAEGH